MIVIDVMAVVELMVVKRVIVLDVMAVVELMVVE